MEEFFFCFEEQLCEDNMIPFRPVYVFTPLAIVLGEKGFVLFSCKARGYSSSSPFLGCVLSQIPFGSTTVKSYQ